MSWFTKERRPGPSCKTCKKPTILLNNGHQTYCWDCDGVVMGPWGAEDRARRASMWARVTGVFK
jgi:hypothetical protein